MIVSLVQPTFRNAIDLLSFLHEMLMSYFLYLRKVRNFVHNILNGSPLFLWLIIQCAKLVLAKFHSLSVGPAIRTANPKECSVSKMRHMRGLK